MTESPHLSDGLRNQVGSSYMATGFMLKQLIVGLVATSGCALFAGPMAGVAVLFGVLLMVGNAAWLDRRLIATQGLNEEVGQQSIYKGAALRFAGLLMGLLIAGVAGLHLLFVALGMFVAQAVLFFAALQRFGTDKT